MSVKKLNKEHFAIMEHTLRRAAGGFYCGTSREMKELVELGFMESAGTKAFVKDEYFRLTQAGREKLKESKQ